MASSRSPVYQLPFGLRLDFTSENIEPLSAFPYPSPPAPPGLPILDDNEFSMLGDFFEKVSSATFDTSEYFSDKALPPSGDSDYLFGWQDEPLPTTFHSTTTTLPQQSMNSHGYDGLNHHHEQMAMNGLPATSSEAMVGPSVAFHNGQVHQNGHGMSDDHMFPTREIASILMEVNNTSSSGQPSMGSFSAHSTLPSDRRRSPNPVMRRLSPNQLVTNYYSALDLPPSRSGSSGDSSDVPPAREIEVKWGSDSNFLGNGYVPPPDRTNLEEREMEMRKTMECLIPTKSNSPINSGPPSPMEKKQKLRKGSGFQSNGSTQDDPSADHSDPRPGKRRKCRSEDADDDEEEDAKVRKGSASGNVKSTRRNNSLSDSFKRRKSQTGQKANRENLTEEQKRSNHIMSEQKRRNLIKQGFDDLCDLVPDLKGGGYSKSAVLLQSADWLEDLLKGNEILRNILASLEGRA